MVLRGTICASSPLRLLRGKEDILKSLFGLVLEEYWAACLEDTAARHPRAWAREFERWTNIRPADPVDVENAPRTGFGYPRWPGWLSLSIFGRETEDGEFVLTDGMRARVADLFSEMGGGGEEIGLAEFRMALIGLGLCFFGGTFVASIAAAEAFMLCGWDTTKRALDDVYGELKSIKDASVADAKKDDDHDGKGFVCASSEAMYEKVDADGNGKIEQSDFMNVRAGTTRTRSPSERVHE